MMKYKVAAYVRLSKDDKYTESNSINNQKNVIKEYINNNSDLDLVDYYVDNGYSGTNFNRPSFATMCLDIVKKKINCVIVKDMSRFGRDYGWIKVYLGETFPEHNIRFISISDNLDSIKNENYTDSLEFALLNITYEHYAIDISEKVSAVKHMQQNKGDFIGVSAPYGYLKDPNDCHKFIIDDYAANIVKEIFYMILEGKSKKEITNILNKENVLTPSKYKSEVTKVTSEKTIQSNSWNNHMVNEILKNETYIGTLIQGKSRKQSRKTKKMIKTDQIDWKICKNHHNPIVDKETFEMVQKILKFSQIIQEENELLISKLVCGECSSDCYRRKAKGILYYWCKSSFRKIGCNLKAVRKDALENMILRDINSNQKKDFKILTKDIINKYVDKIELYNNGEIAVTYKK
ncbi:MAG: recombinase family protein [Bacilli bacterium]|nr:recombinase family protein [Bacilli bacterium]